MACADDAASSVAISWASKDLLLVDVFSMNNEINPIAWNNNTSQTRHTKHNLLRVHSPGRMILASIVFLFLIDQLPVEVYEEIGRACSCDSMVHC